MLGKKTWFLYAAAKRFHPLRHYRAGKAINIAWYCFDRGGGDAIIRLLRRRHLLDLSKIADPHARVQASLTDWVLSSFCADHDIQNGLCHGCSRGIQGPSAVYKSVYKAVRSVRDCLGKLLTSLPTWLESRLEISECVYDKQIVLTAWLAIGAKPHVAESLADINLRFEGGFLKCTPKVLEMPNPAEHIGKLIIACYRFTTFTTSRLGTLEHTYKPLNQNQSTAKLTKAR